MQASLLLAFPILICKDEEAKDEEEEENDGLSELVVAVLMAVAAFRPSFLACPSGLLR